MTDTMSEELVHPFGWHLLITLEDCSKEKIGDPANVLFAAFEIARVAGVHVYSSRNMHSQVEHYGVGELVEGVTAFVPLTTSSLCIHAVDATRCLYVDMFSCTSFSPNAVEDQAVREFGGTVRSSRFITV